MYRSPTRRALLGLTIALLCGLGWHTATAQDLILAEMEVKLEEQRLADAKARTDACRKALAPQP